ncbi:MAG: NAD(P)-dependent oxidoreductase [Candidatus Micrarchaeia archaeon]
MILPLFVDVKGKNIAIAGSGRVGSRRAKKLAKAGAKVTVYSLKLPGKKVKGIEYRKKSLSEKNIAVLFEKKPFLVVGATSSVELNMKISQTTKKRDVLCSCSGAFKKGDVVFPSSSKKGKTLFCITTGDPKKSREKIKKIKKSL